MKQILLILALLVLNGCSKTETVEMVCGLNYLELNGLTGFIKSTIDDEDNTAEGIKKLEQTKGQKVIDGWIYNDITTEQANDRLNISYKFDSTETGQSDFYFSYEDKYLYLWLEDEQRYEKGWRCKDIQSNAK